MPLATIAADAGVGIGTLYRRYASREALLAALTHRSFQRVLEAARLAADSDGTAVDALRSFIDQTIDHGAELVLPLHGGPVPLDPGTQALRTEVHATIEQILSRGRQDGSVRPDVFAFDIVLFGALLAQPLPQVPDWKLMARRQAGIYLDRLDTAPTAKTPRSQRPNSDGTPRPLTPGHNETAIGAPRISANASLTAWSGISFSTLRSAMEARWEKSTPANWSTDGRLLVSLSVAFGQVALPVGCPRRSWWYWKGMLAPAFKKVSSTASG